MDAVVYCEGSHDRLDVALLCVINKNILKTDDTEASHACWARISPLRGPLSTYRLSLRPGCAFVERASQRKVVAGRQACSVDDRQHRVQRMTKTTQRQKGVLDVVNIAAELCRRYSACSIRERAPLVRSQARARTSILTSRLRHAGLSSTLRTGSDKQIESLVKAGCVSGVLCNLLQDIDGDDGARRSGKDFAGGRRYRAVRTDPPSTNPHAGLLDAAVDALPEPTARLRSRRGPDVEAALPTCALCNNAYSAFARHQVLHESGATIMPQVRLLCIFRTKMGFVEELAEGGEGKGKFKKSAAAKSALRGTRSA